MPFASPTLADVHTFAYELYFNHFSFQFEKKLEKKSELTQSDTPFLEKWTPLRALEVTQKTWLWQSFFQVYANSHSTSQPLWLLYYEESTSLHAPIRYSTHCLYISISTKMAASHLIFADDARCLCRENMHIVGNLVHNKTALFPKIIFNCIPHNNNAFDLSWNSFFAVCLTFRGRVCNEKKFFVFLWVTS